MLGAWSRRVGKPLCGRQSLLVHVLKQLSLRPAPAVNAEIISL